MSFVGYNHMVITLPPSRRSDFSPATLPTSPYLGKGSWKIKRQLGI